MTAHHYKYAEAQKQSCGDLNEWPKDHQRAVTIKVKVSTDNQ
jgi:hypothetical protein